MMYIIFAIVIAIIFTKISKLENSIKVLQSEIFYLKKPGASVPTQTTPVVAEQYAPAPQQFEPAKVLEVRRSVEAEAQSNIDIGEWFRENLILKIGVLMLLAGFGWFVSYAFIHNWIGPVGRITLGVLAGTLITIFGTIRLYKDKTQGIAFTILGSALVIITVLAGQYFYDFFSPLSVLFIVFLVSLYVSFSAFAHSLENLAVYGLLVSLTAPYFSHTREMDPVVMYLYLFVISATTIWVAVAKNWRTTMPIGVTGVLLYSLTFFWGNSDFLSTKYTILLISYITAIMYLVVNISSLIKNQIKISGGDVYLTIVNTATIIGITMAIVPTIYQSLTIAGWMLVYAFSGFFVFSKTKNEKMFFIHSLISILLLAIATTIELSGHTLVIAFAIEAAVIIVASYVVTEKIKISANFAFLMIVPFIMSLPSFISSKWDTGVMHSDFAVLAVVAGVLLALGIFFRLNKENETEEFKINHLMFILSTFYVYSLIWLSSGAMFQNSDMAVFVSLFIYTIIGLITHFTGLFKHHVVLKNYGMVLLVLVVLRLVVVDVWNMELSLRIVTFIVLGIMFISTAFISKSQNKEVSKLN